MCFCHQSDTHWKLSQCRTPNKCRFARVVVGCEVLYHSSQWGCQWASLGYTAQSAQSLLAVDNRQVFCCLTLAGLLLGYCLALYSCTICHCTDPLQSAAPRRLQRGSRIVTDIPTSFCPTEKAECSHDDLSSYLPYALYGLYISVLLRFIPTAVSKWAIQQPLNHPFQPPSKGLTLSLVQCTSCQYNS